MPEFCILHINIPFSIKFGVNSHDRYFDVEVLKNSLTFTSC